MIIKEIKIIKPEFMTIDKTTFKYYISVELDKISEKNRDQYGENHLFDKAINEAYFKIMERFEPYFKELEDKDEEE